MVVQFKDREQAFENMFAHDAEMQFRAEARRNRFLGMWAAGLLGRHGEDAVAYAKEVVRADFEAPGDEAVVRKVSTDLGELADAETVRAKMAEFLTRAKAELADES